MRLCLTIIIIIFYFASFTTWDNKEFSNSQNNIVHHGTLLISGIGEDGIVIAADSRLTYSNQLNTGSIQAISYTDSCQKIFVLKKTPMAVAGRYVIANKEFSNFARHVDSGTKLDSQLDIEERAKYFIVLFCLQYLFSKDPAGSTLFFTGGFRKNTGFIKRTICIEDYNPISEVKSKKGFLFSDDSAKSIFLQKLKDTSKLLSCKKLATLFEETIKEFSKGYL